MLDSSLVRSNFHHRNSNPANFQGASCCVLVRPGGRKAIRLLRSGTFIDRIWHEQFEVVMSVRQNAFVGTPAMHLLGPDSFRYTTARALVALDRFLCYFGIVKGFDRKLIARKRS